MQSMNFRYPGLPPAIDRLGADAEWLLSTYPDLAAVRARQLIEVMATHLEGKVTHRHVHGERLGDRFYDLPPGSLPKEVHPGLFENIIRDLNKATHYRTTGLRDIGPIGNRAAKHLGALSDVFARIAGVEPTPFVPLPDTEKSTHHIRRIHLVLDRAQHLADNIRDAEGAEAALQSLSMSDIRRGEPAQEEIDLIELRIDSIRLAIANHRGVSNPPTTSTEQIIRLQRWDDIRGRDEVHHYINRTAISHLNALEIDQAEECISACLNWREFDHEGAKDALGDDPIFDYQRGALLGTLGQIIAMRAHAHQDPLLVDKAIAIFQEASQYFDDEIDQERQHTYRLHGLLERVRLGGSLSEDERLELDCTVRGFDASFLVNPDAQGDIFRLVVALKASSILDIKLPWEAPLLQWAKSLPMGEPLPHPLSAIAGWMLLKMDNVPKNVESALEATANDASRFTQTTNQSELIEWLSAVFLAEHRSEPVPEAPPSLQPWWTTHEIGDRRASTPVAVLPFNYA